MYEDNLKATFIYGPQTSGKSTKLINIIKKDNEKNIVLSAENNNQISNGKLCVNTTSKMPSKLNNYYVYNLSKKVNYPIKHIIIDGIQYLSINYIKTLYIQLIHIYPKIPIILAGCLYYLKDIDNKDSMISTSKYLFQKCTNVIAMKRKCTYCNKNSNRLWTEQINSRESNQIIVTNPILVCEYHYQNLLKKYNK